MTGSGRGIANRAVAIITHEGRVLLHRGAHERTWSLPGGRIEPGEPAAEALRRELREELGLDATVGRLLWVVESFYHDGGAPRHEIGHYFAVTAPDDWPHLQASAPFAGVEIGKELTFQWFGPHEIVALPLNPACLQGRLASPPAAPEHLVNWEL